MPCSWSVFGPVSLLFLAGTFAGALGASLSEVTACPRNDELCDESVCLQLRFVVDTPAQQQTATALCVASSGERSKAPSFPEDFKGARLSVCSLNSTGYCFAHVRDLQPGATYFAFCIDAASPGKVLPPCTGNGTSGCGVPVDTIPSGPFDTEREFGIQSLCGALLLMVYMVWSFRFDHIHGVHETAVAVLAGLLFGFIVLFAFGTTPAFNTDVFSYLLLPMIIFDAGFNLEKKRFFWYALNITMYGLVGTVTIFMLIYFGSGAVEMAPWLFQTWDQGEISLSIHDRLMMASVLSSTDSVAPIAFLPKESFPRLFAIVFGEGVLNDVVAVLLSQSVAAASALPSLQDLAAKILYYLVSSSIVGALFGCGVSYAYKWNEWLQEEVTHPCALLLLANYTCFIVTEMLGFSSIFALFLCALLCGHYAQFSLSKDAQHFADEISEFFAYCAESFVFGYFGFTAVGYLVQPETFSPALILFYSACILTSRFLTVLVIRGTLVILNIHHKSLRWGHAWVVALAGCTRGAISYALVLRAMPPAELQTTHQKVLISTVLGIVLVNCLVFGAIFPAFLRAMGVEPVPSDGSVGTPLGREADEPAPRFTRSWIHQKWQCFDEGKLQPLLRKADVRSP